MPLSTNKSRYLAYVIYTAVFVGVMFLIPQREALEDSIFQNEATPQILMFVLTFAFPQLILHRFTPMHWSLCFGIGFLITGSGYLAHQFLSYATVQYYSPDFDAYVRISWATIYLWQFVAVHIISKRLQYGLFGGQKPRKEQPGDEIFPDRNSE